MINLLHTFHPSPILISLGPIHIYWYGFFILLGALLVIFMMLKLAPYYGIERIRRGATNAAHPNDINIVFDLSFYLIIGGIIGARIYHIFLELPYYLEHPLNIFKIWQGGLAIHGGIIAGIIIIYFFSKKNNAVIGHCPVPAFWLLTAILAPGLALAQSMGRWGNYFNQELFGLPTGKPWGIPIDAINRPAEYLSSPYFHPTFLYESIGNLIIFIILISIHIWIIKKGKQKNPISHKLTAISYLILYSLLRFSLEFLRIDTTPEFLGLRFPQIVSILIIIASTAILLKNKKNYANI